MSPRDRKPARPFKQTTWGGLLQKEYEEFLVPETAHLAMQSFAELPPEERQAHVLRVNLLSGLAIVDELGRLGPGVDALTGELRQIGEDVFALDEHFAALAEGEGAADEAEDRRHPPQPKLVPLPAPPKLPAEPDPDATLEED